MKKYLTLIVSALTLLGVAGCCKDREEYGGNNAREVPEGAVDLGLSVYWSECNIGAEKPEEYGDYFAWGETEPKSDYSWASYKWCNDSNTTLTKYNTNSSNGIVDNKTALDPDDDVASVKLGGNWRLPTDREWNELMTKCKWEWTVQNGVNGQIVTARNGNSIFLPAAGYREGTDLYRADTLGYYWSSSLYSTAFPDYAWYLYFYYSDYYSNRVYRNIVHRYYGRSVRPVFSK